MSFVRNLAGQVQKRTTLVWLLGWELALHHFDMRKPGIWHQHSRPMISLCFAGSAVEIDDHRVRYIRPGRLRIRPAGYRHRVYGGRFRTVLLIGPKTAQTKIWPNGPETEGEVV